MEDKILKNLVDAEAKRQKNTLNLIPSENIASRAVREILASPLLNKYSEGYPGKRYYAGNKVIDRIEFLAQERARELFRLGKNWHINVQPYSGSPANLAVYFALLGARTDTDKIPRGTEQAPAKTDGSYSHKPVFNPHKSDIMGMSLPFGGHLTHGWKVSVSGQLWRTAQYGVGRDGYIDYKETRKLARKFRPKIIVCGATAYPRVIDFRKFASIAREVNAYLMADIAHIAGLIAAGVHHSPFPYADIVTTTTHKTLRGPRGAIIFANRQSPIAQRNKIDIAAAIDKAVFPGLQGGPHDNQTAAIAQCLYEASRPSFRKYGRQVIKNAKALARELQKFGFNLVSGGTDNHLMLIDLTNLGISGREAQDKLEEAGVIVNRNTIPYDARSPFDPSGIRLGSPAITSRGMKEKEMRKIAEFIYRVLTQKDDPRAINRDVARLCSKFPF